MNKDSAGAEKSKNKLRKRVKKREDEKEKAKEEASVDISMSNVMTLGTLNAQAGPSNLQPTTEYPSRSKAAKANEDDQEVHSETEEQERALESKGKGRGKGVKAFEQRDLVARAFAGDNVMRVRDV